MKCFYHPDRDAVAMCKSCNRGLCLDCSADIPPGVACRDKCEADVAALNLVLQRSKTAYQKTGASYRGIAITMLIAGIFFTGFGLIPIIVSRNYGALFFVPIGGIFLLLSYFSHRSGEQIMAVDYRSGPGAAPDGGSATPTDNSRVTRRPPPLT